MTGKEQTWQVCRAYGCNSIIASENLLTFRSGAAGYYDLKTRSGTGNLGGFKSGCTSNLVVANGVLNAPDYTRTCSCGYQNQTSLGLVHMPEIEMWTINHEARLTEPGQRVERLGVNFGAPGDRVDQNGTLWIEWPPVGGEQANLNIDVEGDTEWYRTSSLKFSGDGPAWIGASGVVNARRISIPMQIADPNAGKQVFGVTQESDDAEENEDGSVSLESSDLELVEDKSRQHVGIRFSKVDIPQGARIHTAYLQFTADEKGAEPTELSIQAIDATSPTTFTEQSHSVSSRGRLEAKVVWKPERWKKEDETGERQRSPDLKKLVQQLVDRPDWKAGNAIGFVITGEGQRTAYSSTGPKGPKLVIGSDAHEASSQQLAGAPLHTVRLYFAEPDAEESSAHSFSVSLQGKPAIEGLNIVDAAGGARRTIVREFRNVSIADRLTVEFTADRGRPILSGVEVLKE